MNISDELKAILEEIMDIDSDKIDNESYMIRELETESIDLLEIAVEISTRFNINVDDDTVFLTQLRSHLKDIQDEARIATVMDYYPQLEEERAKEIISDIDNGPVLKFKDLEAYIENAQKENS